ncbi:hypothetical protein ACQP04_14705 [Pseudonocardia halophobica]|uniref:hypothetical protein n=1 Tax=Pseudonocardia halophobica TaxID=29401 RepID=UPI003D93B9AA
MELVARKRFAGLRLRATDLDWSAGEGEEVRGPAGDLLLLATGPPVGLDALDGPGVTQAAARVGRGRSWRSVIAC